MHKPVSLLIITPIFPPATGGAAVYYDFLIHELLRQKSINRIVVLTERMPGLQNNEWKYDGRLLILRRFPYRAGGLRQPLMQYLKYGYQNIQYLTLPNILPHYNVNIVIVHSSFHNFPNLMSRVVNRCIKLGKWAWIADIRDWQLPLNRLKELDSYDRLIVCSENVIQHIAQRKSLLSKSTLIPVIQEPLQIPAHEEIQALKSRLDLEDKQYLSYIGLIKKEKGVDLLLDSFKILASRHPEIHLVLAGIMKEFPPSFHKRINNTRIHYVGELSRKDTIVLTAGSVLHVNLSPSEGLPRNSLEALSMGMQVALPPNVPEFQKHCPDHVINEREPEKVAGHLERLLLTAKKPLYPISMHYPNRILSEYEKLFMTLTKIS